MNGAEGSRTPVQTATAGKAYLHVYAFIECGTFKDRNYRFLIVFWLINGVIQLNTCLKLIKQLVIEFRQLNLGLMVGHHPHGPYPVQLPVESRTAPGYDIHTYSSVLIIIA